MKRAGPLRRPVSHLADLKKDPVRTWTSHRSRHHCGCVGVVGRHQTPLDYEKVLNPLAMLQHGMKFFLRLEHQLEVVDYGKANFIHARFVPGRDEEGDEGTR
jgi:hypothetical protein